MGICAWTPLDIFAVSLGLLNILCWIFAQAPQIYKNWKKKETEALSVAFLLTWLTGDITNLISSFLTQQLPVQQYTAIYFCIIDAILITQWIYYTKFFNPSGRRSTAPLIQPHEINQKYGIIYFLVVSNVITLPLLLQHTHSSDYWEYSVSPSRQLLNDISNNYTLPNCEFKPFIEDWLKIFGDVCAWVSGILYLLARLPQIHLNYKRRSVKGLSISMFFVMNVANICYGTSVLLLIPNFNTQKFFVSDLPFVIGSLGAVFPNTFILMQWVYYDYYMVRAEKDEYQVV